MKSFLNFPFILVALTISSCSTNAPLKSLYYAAEESRSPKNMIVFLRGRGGSHEDFASKGFVDAFKMRKLPYDMIAPNAHLGYYIGETLVARLKADIIDPIRAKGYENVWLVGASMGGLGALMYSRFHPEDVEGILIISPFLGYDKIVSEIESQGGVRQWDPGEYNPDKDWQRMIWHWLKQYAAAAGSHSRQISRAIDWLTCNFNNSLQVDELDSYSGMSTSTFHHHFRAMTVPRPIMATAKSYNSKPLRIL